MHVLTNVTTKSFRRDLESSLLVSLGNIYETSDFRSFQVHWSIRYVNLNFLKFSGEINSSFRKPSDPKFARKAMSSFRVQYCSRLTLMYQNK